MRRNQLITGAMVVLVLLTLLVSVWLEQKVVYQSNVGDMKQNSNGYFQTDDLQLNSGQRYTIYLVNLTGFSIPPSFHSSTSSSFEPPVDLHDSSNHLVRNLMTVESSYGTSSETAFKIAEFRYDSDAQDSLLLSLKDTLDGPLSDYELVIRETRYASPMLLIFSDRLAFLFVAAFAVYWWFKQSPRELW